VSHVRNRHFCWELLDRQTLDQRLQVLRGLVNCGLSERYRLTDQQEFVHKLLVVREVRALRDCAVGYRSVDPVNFLSVA